MPRCLQRQVLLYIIKGSPRLKIRIFTFLPGFPLSAVASRIPEVETDHDQEDEEEDEEDLHTCGRCHHTFNSLEAFRKHKRGCKRKGKSRMPSSSLLPDLSRQAEEAAVISLLANQLSAKALGHNEGGFR